MKGKTNCGIYTQWNTIQPQERNKILTRKILTRYNVDEPQKHYSKSKTQDTKDHILIYDSLHIKYPNR